MFSIRKRATSSFATIALASLALSLGCRGVASHLSLVPPGVQQNARDPDPTRPLVETALPPEGTPTYRAGQLAPPGAEVSLGTVMAWLLAGAATGQLPLLGLFGTFDELEMLGIGPRKPVQSGQSHEEDSAEP